MDFEYSVLNYTSFFPWKKKKKNQAEPQYISGGLQQKLAWTNFI